MNLNRTELRKIQYDFNSWSSRLLQADFRDYLDTLKKYLAFLDKTPIVSEYISDCGRCDFDVEEMVKEVSAERSIFSIGDTDEQEVRNVYAILKYIVEHKIEVHWGLAWGYSSSHKFQDVIKGFNERFVMVLIRHIEIFLTKVGIDMGLDEKQVYNVSVQHGQAIFAGDNSTITATNNIGVSGTELDKLIGALREAAIGLSSVDKEALDDSIEVIETEAKAEKPKKSMLRTAITGLTAIKGTAEFGAAAAALVQFVTTLL